MSVFELAKKYYPRLWPIKRLDALLTAGMLTQEEYDALTAEDRAAAEEGAVTEEADHVY